MNNPSDIFNTKPDTIKDLEALDDELKIPIDEVRAACACGNFAYNDSFVDTCQWMVNHYGRCKYIRDDGREYTLRTTYENGKVEKGTIDQSVIGDHFIFPDTTARI